MEAARSGTGVTRRFPAAGVETAMTSAAFANYCALGPARHCPADEGALVDGLVFFARDHLRKSAKKDARIESDRTVVMIARGHRSGLMFGGATTLHAARARRRLRNRQGRGIYPIMLAG